MPSVRALYQPVVLHSFSLQWRREEAQGAPAPVGTEEGADLKGQKYGILKFGRGVEWEEERRGVGREQEGSEEKGTPKVSSHPDVRNPEEIS